MKEKQPNWSIVLLSHKLTNQRRAWFSHKKQWILVTDVFKAHWMDAVTKIISDNNGVMIPVPNNMTSYLQPLSLTISRFCKAFLRTRRKYVTRSKPKPK